MIHTLSNYSNTSCEIKLTEGYLLYLRALDVEVDAWQQIFFHDFESSVCFSQAMNLPPSSWFVTQLKWTQLQWGQWKPHFTWSAPSAPRNTLQKWWAAWHKSQRHCSRPEPTPTCRTARAGRSKGVLVYELYWIVEVVLQLCLLLFLGLHCMKLWHQGMSQCSTSYCSANSKLHSAFK